MILEPDYAAAWRRAPSTVQDAYDDDRERFNEIADAACVPLYVEIERQANLLNAQRAGIRAGVEWREKAERIEQEATDYRAALEQYVARYTIYSEADIAREALAKHKKADA